MYQLSPEHKTFGSHCHLEELFYDRKYCLSKIMENLPHSILKDEVTSHSCPDQISLSDRHKFE